MTAGAARGEGLSQINSSHRENSCSSAVGWIFMAVFILMRRRADNRIPNQIWEGPAACIGDDALRQPLQFRSVARS